jgi:hypothetical protein
MPLTPSERRQRATLAAQTSWANTADRTARTEAGRAGMRRKIENERMAHFGESAWRAMTGEQQAQAVDAAYKAHFAGLALKASQARRAKAGAAQ